VTSVLRESEVTNLVPDIEPEHRFVVTLEPDNFTDEKFALFSNYQRHVHHETDGDVTRSGFQRFLCDSSLHRHPDRSDGKPLGSYHQCYRLDGRLIAMGVLDLLPHAVSGVYFIYHSDYEKWSFGKLSALREAALAMEQGYKFYYMGYYIHSCKKMRYKGDYKPQYVLDYASFEWDLLDDEMRSLMEKREWASMSKERARKAGATMQQADANGDLQLSDETHSEEEVLHPSPLAAMNSSLSLLALGMPGVLSPAELEHSVDLDTMRITLDGRGVHQMQDIVSWARGNVLDPATVKGRIAEFAAAVGPDVAREVTADFGRG